MTTGKIIAALFWLAHIIFWATLSRLSYNIVQILLCDILTAMSLLCYALTILPLDLPKTDIPANSIPQTAYNRTLALRKNGGKHTQQQWFDLKKAFNYKCVRCGIRETIDNPLTRDHIVPLYVGGSNNISNIQPLCKSCNSVKGTNTFDYR